MKLWNYYSNFKVIKNGRKVGLKNSRTGLDVIPAQCTAINVVCPRYADQVSFIKVKQDKKYFLCNLNGKRITEKMDYIGEYNSGIVSFSVAGRWGFLDDAGHYLMLPIYTGVEDLELGRFKVKRAGKWGVVDKRGEIVKPAYDNIVVHEQRLFGIKNGSMIRLLV